MSWEKEEKFISGEEGASLFGVGKAVAWEKGHRTNGEPLNFEENLSSKGLIAVTKEVAFSGMWCWIVCHKFTCILEECTASVFKVEE
jgi:hypothetical protein